MQVEAVLVQRQFVLPLSGKAVAILTVPSSLEQDDVETLAEYLEIVKKVLRKSRRETTGPAHPVRPPGVEPGT